MKIRRNVIRFIYLCWAVWAWWSTIHAGDLLRRLDVLLFLIAFSALTAALLFPGRVAWWLAPLPALAVAAFTALAFVSMLGASFGLVWYHDPPGVAYALLFGVLLPAPAIAVLTMLWLDRAAIYNRNNARSPRAI